MIAAKCFPNFISYLLASISFISAFWRVLPSQLMPRKCNNSIYLYHTSIPTVCIHRVHSVLSICRRWNGFIASSVEFFHPVWSMQVRMLEKTGLRSVARHWRVTVWCESPPLKDGEPWTTQTRAPLQPLSPPLPQLIWVAVTGRKLNMSNSRMVSFHLALRRL